MQPKQRAGGGVVRSAGSPEAPRPRMARLLHSIVILGAAIGAGSCGDVVVDSGGPGGGSTTGGSGGSAGQGGAGEGGAGASGGSGQGGEGGASIVDGPEDCAHPAEYFCEGESCFCDPTAPHGPEDCEGTWQFSCIQYEPEVQSCMCDPNAPSAPEDCQDPNLFYCYSYDPPIGCYCLVPIA